MQDLITVIIPVFRTEPFLRRCVDSVRGQSYENLEIILVDDGSDDGAPMLCDQLAAEDGRITVIHKANGGQSSARNTGIDKASGAFISFVDSDDYIAPDMISTLHTLAVENSCDIAKVDYISVKTDKHQPIRCRKKARVYAGGDVEEAFLDLSVDSACVCLYRRSVIGDIRFPAVRISEDAAFNFEVFQKANRLVYLPAAKYFYYNNSASASNGRMDANKLHYLDFREEIYRHYAALGNRRLTDKAGALAGRAAMGLLVRAALFGIDEQLDEKKCCDLLKKAFDQHKDAYYRARNVSSMRKLLAFGITHFYPLARRMRFLFR